MFPPLAVSIRQAAAMIGVSQNTIRRQIAATFGRLATVRIGRRRLISVESLQQFLKEKTEK